MLTKAFKSYPTFTWFMVGCGAFVLKSDRIVFMRASTFKQQDEQRKVELFNATK